MEIGLISDTHGFLDPQVFRSFEKCDEVWHAGDFGSLEVFEQLQQFKPLRAVFGNVDDEQIRDRLPEDLRFNIDGLDIWITHIVGRPGRYDSRVRKGLDDNPPDVLICGHSHILLVESDPKYSLQYLNPGAAGHHGTHQVRTLLKFEIAAAKLNRIRVVELGPRGRARLPDP